MPGETAPDLRRISFEAHGWVIALEDPQVSTETKADFDTWLQADQRHQSVFDKVKLSVAATQTLHGSDFPNLKSTPKYLLARPYLMEGVYFFKDRKPLSFGLGGAVAACVALVLFISTPQKPVPPISPAPMIAAYQSDVGELKTLTLSDGTEVTLGGRSSIETEFYPNKRLVTLSEGKSYFEVAPDPQRPFSVLAGDLTATAVGTAFDVQSNGATYRVGATEGQVEVEYPFMVDGQNMGMTITRKVSAGQQVVATTAKGLENVVDTKDKFLAVWRSGKLVYRDVSVGELIIDLNRYSNTPIEIEPASSNITALRFGGIFQDQSIEDVLAMLADTHPIYVDRSDPELIFLREK